MVVYGILIVVSFIAALALLRPASRSCWVVVAVSCAAGMAAWLVIEVIWRPFPDRNPVSVYLVWTVAVTALLSLVVVLVRRGVGAGRRALAVFTVFVGLAGAAGWTNGIYQQYPTLRSLHPVPAAKAMTYQEFQRTTEPPVIDGRVVGAKVTVELPSSTGFRPRPAVAYVPPDYWRTPYRKLPVLMLMPGNPGSPDQWFTNGAAEETADAYQAQHGGLSPIIVSVDATGSLTGNPACVGDAQTYVATDAPAKIAELFRTDPRRTHWTIGGLSYGGTCALQVVTNQPQAFGTFLNFSGQAEPTLGSHQETVDRLFDGDETAFAAENPADLLVHNRYDGVAGLFVAGSSDKESTAALKQLHELADRAGMDTDYHEVPGGHSFEVWRAGLRLGLPLAAMRGGIQ